MFIAHSQAKLPEQYELDVIRKAFGDVITPTTVVLLQELERFNKLIKRMEVSLSSLQKVQFKSVCVPSKLIILFVRKPIIVTCSKHQFFLNVQYC